MNGGRLRSVGLIAGREMREHRRSATVWTLIITAVGLAVFAAHVGIADWRVRRDHYLDLERQRAADRAAAGQALFGWQLEPSLRVILPPDPSAALAGASPQPAAFWDFGPAGIRSGPSPYEGGALETLDLEFIVRVVLGLLALVLSIQAVAGDRSDGSLLALLGQAVRPSDVMLGKIAGSALTLMAGLAIVLAAAWLTLWAEGMPRGTADVALVLVALGGGTLYLLACWTGGAMCGLLPVSFRTVIATAFVLWAFGSLLAVAAARSVEQTFWPVRPSLIADAERERSIAAATHAVQLEMGDAFVDALGGPDGWLRRRDDPRLLREAERRIGPIWSEFIARLRRMRLEAEAQRDWAAARRNRFDLALRTLNPASAFRGAMQEAAFAGRAARDRWGEALRAHAGALNRDLFDDRPRIFVLAPLSSPAGDAGSARRLTVSVNTRPPASWETLPAFTSPTRSAAERLRDAGPALLTQATYTLLLLGLLIGGFARWAVGEPSVGVFLDRVVDRILPHFDK